MFVWFDKILLNSSNPLCVALIIELLGIIYELRTSPDNAAIFKSIICKASHPDNNPTIQFIPYRIQVTNKDIYKTLIKKQNVFISDSSIISIYEIEEGDVNKFKKTNY